jgi:hypothetical protein
MFLKNIAFRRLDLFPSSGKNNGGPYYVGSLRKSYPQSLAKGPKMVGNAIILPEDENRSSFRNVVFFKKH